MKTGVYARISLDPRGTEIGVNNQVANGRELCARNDWGDPETFVDDDLSATYGGPRPSYDRLLAAIMRGSITRVIVYHLSRLWRNRAERAAGIEIMKRRSVSIVCVKGPSLDMSTAYGRAMAGLLGEFDTMEVEIKSERQLMANLERAKAGQPHVGGRRGFGYEPDNLTVRPAEAKAIKDACDAILSGVPITEIARTWTAAGFRTGRSDSPFRASAVRVVLTNPRIAGIRAHHGVEISPAVWPAIVTEETFRAVAAYLAQPGRHTGGTGRVGQRLLTGVALCGIEGCGLTVNGGGAGRFGPLYRCPSQRHLSRQAPPVEQYVEAHVIQLLSRPGAADLVVDRGLPDVDALREKATALRTRIRATREEFAEDDTLSPSELREILSTLRDKLAAVEQRMADAGRADLLGPLIRADSVDAAWSAYSRDRQRAVINALMVIWLLPPGQGARRFDPATVRIKPKA